ncbi:M48 family metalloprotease [Chthonobacter rhizosphaerae]|uniref:M48 family metalloprotease n=1 Tax=Chthonobacter rhizosphaerae TaxID=2735553 RepID=UPI0015EEECF8|nr:M48 family metalloprotease [Chthonobacter rhizosphaerae]
MVKRLTTLALAAVTAGAVLLNAVAPAFAQGRRVSLIRDAEAEALIADYARPILKAAGLGGASIEIKIVNDPAFNAFVADSRHIFINAGTLMQSETPNELIGVIAHETGHLAGNHLARLREAVRKAQILSAIAMLGGAAAAVAGGSAGAPGAGRAGAAAAVGGAQMGQRSILAYQRSEETSADRAALTYLEKTGQSPKGMLDVFERLADQQLFSAMFNDPYALSHPLAAERLSQVREVAEKSRHFGKTDDPALVARHALVRAKFVAFTGDAGKTARAYPPSDTSLPAQYARAVVTWRYGDPRSAVKAMDALIEQQPSNPYFHELKGQILLEGGQPRQAVDPLRRAVKLAPRAGMIRVMLGHALVASDDAKALPEAIEHLTKGLGDDPDNSVGYRQLAIAHARAGNIPMADLATAQGAFASGDIKAAKQYAVRAQAKLKRGSPAWLRADDIVTYNPPRY